MTDPAPRYTFSLAWLIKNLIVFSVLAGVLAATWQAVTVGPLKENKDLIVPRGTSVPQIAALLYDNGVISNKLVFQLTAKLTVHNLKAGEYEFTPGQSMREIAVMMQDGRTIVHHFTAAEGLTSAEIVALLKNSPALAGDAAVPAEGSMLPETYRYTYGDTRAGIVARMQKAMDDTVKELWAQRDAAIPLKSPQEAVVLASIVEKETGKAAERPRIAGVFYNRLRANMKLQSDPTVIYGIVQAKGPMGRELGHDDLAFASPYNTYVIDGLPPAPICNPGRAALTAALHPETNEFLYFVADGTGGHVFAKDLAEHNQNVTKWNAMKGK